MTDPNGNPDNSDIGCWEYLWEMEIFWGIDIADEQFWDIDYLQSLQTVFQNFASYVGGVEIWRAILAHSAAAGGRSTFLIRGTRSGSAPGRCMTGCNWDGEVSLNLSLIFSTGNPGFGRVGSWYKTILGEGALTIAHEFAHILLRVFPELQESYNASSSWGDPYRTEGGQGWKGRVGLAKLPDAEEQLVHVIALYVAPGNTWSQVDGDVFNQQGPITPFDQFFVDFYIPFWIQLVSSQN